MQRECADLAWSILPLDEQELSGAALHALTDRGISRVHVTMTHDAGVACAFVVAEGER